MIALAKPTVRANDVHEQFLTMLPWISSLARRAFQRFDSERRSDLVHEVIATAYVAFARLIEQGKQDLAYATPLANFAIRRVLDGRRAGSSMRRNDVMFDARGENDVKVIRRSDRFDEWHEALVEDHHAGPAETAAASERVGLEMLYIEPDSPWQNGFAESFFSRLRDELLNIEEFENLAEARWFAAHRQKEHNEERPHSSLGYRTPLEFASQCAASVRASATPQPSLQQHTAEPITQTLLS